MAKMIGLSAIEATISRLTIPPAESPRKMSAPAITSVSVRALVFLANALLPRVHQLVAALVDHAFDIGDGDVLALHSYPHEQIEAC